MRASSQRFSSLFSSIFFSSSGSRFVMGSFSIGASSFGDLAFTFDSDGFLRLASFYLMLPPIFTPPANPFI